MNVIMLSGGHKSATLLSLAIGYREQARAVFADYGQPGRDAATRVAAHHGTAIDIVDLRSLREHMDGMINRWIILAGIGATIAEQHGGGMIWFGHNDLARRDADDRRSGAIGLVSNAIRAQSKSIRGITTPFGLVDDEGIATWANRLGAPIDITWSCDVATNGRHCGICRGCDARRRTMDATGGDRTEYAICTR
jgi:7-cyano-7-deazaguanine synthase in queuosine biosynthesis